MGRFSLAAYRRLPIVLSSIDYIRVLDGEPVRTSWELGHAEADGQGCIFVQLSQKVSS